jgi:alpha-mannosidase
VEEGRGFAVLNDCKYGVGVRANSIDLTLLRSPLAPDPGGDNGTHRFLYAAYAWNGSLAESGLVREGYELGCPPLTAAGNGGEKSLISVDSPNVVLETVKPSQNAEEIVLRFYESMRTAVRCLLRIGLPVTAVYSANLLERGRSRLRVIDGGIPLDFKPFEIKTLIVRLSCPGATNTKGAV